MGLNFGTLINAALLGTAAYQGGKRAGQKDKREEDRLAAAAARQAELDRQAAQIHEAQIGKYNSEIKARDWKIEHPDLDKDQRYTAYFDSLIEGGKTREEAEAMARARFGLAPEQPRGPVRGTAEYFAIREKELAQNDRHERRAAGSGTTDDGSDVAADRKRREYLAKRVPALVQGKYTPGTGYSGAMDHEAAVAAANREWAQMQGPSFGDVQGGSSNSGTAALLAKTIPTAGRSSSTNAGTRGVKPVLGTSTPKNDPAKATSPKLGTPELETITAAQAAALKASGYSDAEIRANFVVR